MSKRGKNRPPRIGPPALKPKPIYVKPCANCFRLVDRETLNKETGECGRCQHFSLKREVL